MDIIPTQVTGAARGNFLVSVQFRAYDCASRTTNGVVREPSESILSWCASISLS